jgi:hypothetical protein
MPFISSHSSQYGPLGRGKAFRADPGYADYYGGVADNSYSTNEVYSLAIPAGWTKVLVLAIGPGGGSDNKDSWGGGGGGGGAAKGGYTLTGGETLSISIGRTSRNITTNSTAGNGVRILPATVSSATRGTLLTATGGVTASSGSGGGGGSGTLNTASDFAVQNGGTWSGGSGLTYTGNYLGDTAGSGSGYAGGGGAGGHGNNGGSHGTLQNTTAFNNSLSAAPFKYGYTSYNKSTKGSNSWHNGMTSNPSFGGGSGGHSSGSDGQWGGSGMVRIVWGLDNDSGGTFSVSSHGW